MAKYMKLGGGVTLDLKAVTSSLKAVTSNLKAVTLDLKVVTSDLKAVTLCNWWAGKAGSNALFFIPTMLRDVHHTFYNKAAFENK